MRELSKQARSILETARGAHEPTRADRRRLTRSMVGQTGAAVVLTSATTGGTAAGAGVAGVAAVFGGTSVAVKVIASVAVAGALAGGAAWHHARSAPSETPRAAVARAAPAPIDPPRFEAPIAREVEPREEPVAPAPAASQAPVSSPPARAARLAGSSREDTLALEVSVVGAARRALLEGRPDRALALLDEHAPAFAHGALREEYLAARVLALRALGRAAEARAAAERFAAEMPHSSLAAGLADAEREP